MPVPAASGYDLNDVPGIIYFLSNGVSVVACNRNGWELHYIHVRNSNAHAIHIIKFNQVHLFMKLSTIPLNPACKTVH